MNIFEYLCREARKITEASLKDIKDRSYWIETSAERRRRFIDMLGLTYYMQSERKPVKPVVTGVLKRDGYRVEKLYFQSLPGLYVTGNLYIPEPLEKPAPAVLYLCGHSFNQKHHYQAHARKFAQLGFVTLIIETIQKGEIRGHHHGAYHLGWFNWYSLGYTPAGVEVWNGVRAIDLLQARPEVDADKIGVTGISGGGAMSWFTAAVDERVKVAAPVCGTATIESHVCKRTVEGHCDCMFWINSSLWDLTDVGALIAPRPLLIASAERDWIFDIESVRLIYRKLKRLYEVLDAADKILLVETPGGHSYHEKSRKMIFKWFVKHLKGVDVSLEEVGDIDESPSAQEPLEALKVFDEIPSDERVTTVQEWFIKPAQPPKIETVEELRVYRRRLVETLMEKTFNAFPRNPPDLEVEVELTQESGDWLGYLIGFTSEEGWRLHIQVLKPLKSTEPVPILVFPARSARTLNFGDELVRGLDAAWARAFVELRGIGETSWSPDLQWFIRRAAMLTGRTIASMRVYDLLRAVDALTTLDWVNKTRVALMGSGESAVIALYTALLRGDVYAVILHDPPATQNVWSNPDGTGPAIEMINCLRYTDLPYVAGLLWPTQLVFLGPRPESYAWAEHLYMKLGAPGVVRHVKNLSTWV
ncbi:acetylxylan esterase [Candidatus Bathyarchaeota archaeon]|nr:acetylxylan esterase [Candidatus Bathyarchaeota archaeon]